MSPGKTVPAPVAVLSTRAKDSFPAVDTEMQTVSSCELRCKQLQSSPTRIRLTTSPERSMKRISPLEKWTPAIERTGVAGRVGLGEVRLGDEAEAPESVGREAERDVVQQLRWQHAVVGDGGRSSRRLLPVDILYEVLLRLPANVLCRLRLVCRGRVGRSPRIPPSPGLTFRATLSSSAFVAGLRGHARREVQFVDLSGNVVKRIRITGQAWDYGRNVSTKPSLHCRLIRTTEKGCVLNPSTGAFIVLPANIAAAEHESPIISQSLLGQVPSAGEYKFPSREEKSGDPEIPSASSLLCFFLSSPNSNPHLHLCLPRQIDLPPPKNCLASDSIRQIQWQREEEALEQAPTRRTAVRHLGDMAAGELCQDGCIRRWWLRMVSPRDEANGSRSYDAHGRCPIGPIDLLGNITCNKVLPCCTDCLDV
ncbi:LOW QUALITY PROTEIN: hypothetical protein SETIT_2G072500v2 [Setaria italica]|uniref:F-box domain-containing protein n=1 Tax=Setaria italica TaxID=4555 RepID=A0A368PW00_SETIT|nr:LOW QUALITY PROTEIN: hypothetical protein SETIT_2G072500v2 [Setaria italica]